MKRVSVIGVCVGVSVYVSVFQDYRSLSCMCMQMAAANTILVYTHITRVNKTDRNTEPN